jgi:hypothetical protein
MKSIKQAGAAIALAAAAAFAFAPAASAADCGQPAVYKTVTTEATPAVFGPDVKVIDVEAKEATPGSPAVEEVSHIEHRLVSPAVPGKDAYDEVVTPSQWWNWSPNKDQGPFEGPPAFPVDERGTWEGPHAEGGPGKDEVGTFQQGNGHGSWFHREAAVIVHHDAVPEIPAVYEDVKVIDVEAKDAVPATPAVEEVSHLEKGPLVTPATKATSKQVLVTEATKACPKTTTAVTHRTPPSSTPPAELAFTGSQTQDTTMLALAILAVAGGAYALRRRLA